jgi:hypothetical protein
MLEHWFSNVCQMWHVAKDGDLITNERGFIVEFTCVNDLLMAYPGSTLCKEMHHA